MSQESQEFSSIKFFRNCHKIIIDAKKSVPTWFFYYIVVYLLILFLLVFYVPGNDFDTMSSYIARTKIEEFGPLEQTATLEIQYLFPKFFDYLHKPFLKLGYFITFPNFFLFITFLFILFNFYSKKLYFWFFILIFACQPLLITSTSLKNDVSLGVIGFIGCFLISYFRNKTWYLPVCSLAIAALIGIKWHGILLAFLLCIIMIYSLYKLKLINRISLVILTLFSPLLWIFSSANVYLNNYLKYGSLTPKLDYLGHANISFWKNLYTFISTSILDSFDLPAYYLDLYLFKGHLFELEQKITLGAKIRDFIVIVYPDFNTYGILIILLLALDVYVLFSRQFSSETKSFAAVAITYFLGLMFLFEYINGLNRYLLAVYLLSVVPASEVLASLSLKKWLKGVLVFYALIISLHCLVFNMEKNLLDFVYRPYAINEQTHEPDRSEHYKYQSIFHNFSDRDALYFQIWSGYLDIYNFFRENIFPSDSLLYISKATGNDVPFIYPFIKDRQAANTRIFNTRYGSGNYSELLGKYDYIMIYKGTIEEQRYQLVFKYNDQDEVNIYKLKTEN